MSRETSFAQAVCLSAFMSACLSVRLSMQLARSRLLDYSHTYEQHLGDFLSRKHTSSGSRQIFFIPGSSCFFTFRKKKLRHGWLAVIMTVIWMDGQLGKYLKSN